MERSADFAALRAEHVRVYHQIAREAVAHPAAILDPSGVEDGKRGDRSETEDGYLRPEAAVEAMGHGAIDVRLEVAEEEMGILRPDPHDVFPANAVAHGGGERIDRGRHLGIAALLLPAADQIDKHCSFVDRRQPGHPADATEDREPAIDCRSDALRWEKPIVIVTGIARADVGRN